LRTEVGLLQVCLINNLDSQDVLVPANRFTHFNFLHALFIFDTKFNFFAMYCWISF
jgi:hypothetical protein